MRASQIFAYAAVGVVVVWELFGERFWRFRQKLRDSRSAKDKIPLEQAVIVYLRGSSLPAKIYETYDVSTLEEQLRKVIEGQQVGEYDGNEFGREETVLYMYGGDAERLFSVVEPVLRANPLCREGVAVIRRGPPGSPERRVSLA
jgi:hypothetical protein